MNPCDTEITFHFFYLVVTHPPVELAKLPFCGPNKHGGCLCVPVSGLLGKWDRNGVPESFAGSEEQRVSPAMHPPCRDSSATPASVSPSGGGGGGLDVTSRRWLETLSSLQTFTHLGSIRDNQ